MYSIQNWIYGIPLVDDGLQEAVFSHFKVKWKKLYEDINSTGEMLIPKRGKGPKVPLQAPYVGHSGTQPVYIGFKLKETDETCSFIRVTNSQDGCTELSVDDGETTKLSPTLDQLSALSSWLDSIPKELRDKLPKPGMFIVFSTS